MWLTLLTSNWRSALVVTAIACLSAGMWLQTTRLINAQQALTLEQQGHGQTKEAWRQAAQKAQAVAAQQESIYKLNAERAKHEYQAVVEQAKTRAVGNFIGRYGDPRHLGCGVRLPSTLPGADSPGASAPASDKADDGAGREFVAACARDAGRLGIWQDWCRANNCEVTGG